MTRVRINCEAGFGYTAEDDPNILYTDITSYVRLPDTITITRGAADQLADIQAGTLSLTLNNAGGRFTPKKASSPYFPYVVKNCPIRFQVMTLDAPSGAGPWPLAQLADDFDDGVIDPMWSASYGGPTEVGGRARVPCSAGVFAAYQTPASWTLAGSEFRVRLDTLPAASSGSDVWAQVCVNSATAGTRLTFQINPVTGLVYCRNDTAYFEVAALSFAYDPMFVRWFRFRAAGGNVYWDTSADGVSWTNGRVSVAPAWVATDQVSVSLEAHRDAGTSDFAEFDWAGAVAHPRIWGLANSWDCSWKGLEPLTALTCSDTFKRLASNTLLAPMLNQEIILGGPYAYYPLNEPAGSTSAGDQSGFGEAAALRVVQKGSGGELAFGSGDGPATGQSAALFTRSSSTDGLYLTGNLGSSFWAASATAIIVECWFATTSDGTILTLLATDQNFALSIQIAPGTGYLTVVLAELTSHTAVTAFTGTRNLALGQVHHLLYDSAAESIYIDGGYAGTNTLLSPVGPFRYLTIGAYAGGTQLFTGSISHVAVYGSGHTGATMALNNYRAGTDGFAGEDSGDRLTRVLGYVGMTVDDTGTWDLVGPQLALGQSALQHARDIEAAESGRMFASRAGADVVLQDRHTRINAVASFSLAYVDLENSAHLVTDEQHLVNTVTVSRPGGATHLLRDAASVEANGVADPGPMTLIKISDDAVVSAAAWLLAHRADPANELRQVEIEAPALGVALYRKLLDADVSTVLTVTGMPAEAPASTLTLTAEGYTEVLGEEAHRITAHTSGTDTTQYWVLGDPVLSVLGSTTRLSY